MLLAAKGESGLKKMSPLASHAAEDVEMVRDKVEFVDSLRLPSKAPVRWAASNRHRTWLDRRKAIPADDHLCHLQF